MTTKRSESPGAVAHVLPASSRSTVTPSMPSSSPASQSRAAIHVSVQATRCAPSSFPVRRASSLQAGDGARGVDVHQRTAGPGAGCRNERCTKRPEPARREHLAVAEGERAAHVDRGGATGERHALVRRVVDVPVPVGLRRGDREVGVPHDDVGVGARGEHALATGHAVHRGLVRGEHGDEAVLRDVAAAHAVRPQHRRALLRAGRAVRDLREVVEPQLLLAREVERAVVGAEDLQVRRLQAVPQRRPVARVAQRRREDVLRALEALAREVGVAEHEVLRARLPVDGLAAGVGGADRVERRLAGDVHDEQRRARHLGQPDRPVGGLGLARLGPRRRVEARRGVAARERLVLELGDHVAVLGVHEHEQADLARDLHRLEEVLVGRVQAACPCRP